MPAKKSPVVAYDELPAAPDFLGTAARVQNVADLIQSAQGQLQELEGIRLLNGHDGGDMVPTQNGAGSATYEERFESLRSGIASLLDANRDLSDELTAEAVRRRKKLERKLESEGE